MTGILIAGTSSDAGKSLVVTGLCRALARRGVDVAPFKAQNMSNNSAVCADGAEIGRAQYLQAQAARVEPSAAHNPVLLKPGTDRRAFVVVDGRPAGVLEAGEYATGRGHLAEAAFAAYARLAAAHEIVVVEGAGSPAEINLRERDYVNLGLARRFGLPVVLVGDIDRGGVLASLYGTWALVDDADRALLRGYVINKFRGDEGILRPGLDAITRRTGMPCLGVLPWLEGVWLDGEDALEVARWVREPSREPSRVPDADPGPLTVAVVRFPRISNATDVDALAHTPGVAVTVTTDPAVAASADLLVLPGSRSTVGDLAWLRARGLDAVVHARHAAGLPPLGVCGGYELLAGALPAEVESGAGSVPGLGVLPVDVVFGEKTTARTTHRWAGLEVEGYEIHHGHCTPTAPADGFLDGCRVGATFGTMLHGALEDDAFRHAFLGHVASLAGRVWQPDAAAPGHAARREAMIDTLADAVEEHLDLDALVALAGFHLDGRAVSAARASESRPGLDRLDLREGLDKLDLREGLDKLDLREGLDRRGLDRGRPRLMVHTGDGKGKSTAAFGMALRAWARGWPVGVYQFVKSPAWRTGEREAFAALDELHRTAGRGGPVAWHVLGAGRTALRATRDVDQAALARAGWDAVRADLAAATHRLLVLDEFAHVLAHGWVDPAEVLDVLARRPGEQHVVITGRRCPPSILDAADLVTDMTKLKHPFDAGARGLAGLEW